jgi:hypothetical protein
MSLLDDDRSLAAGPRDLGATVLERQPGRTDRTAAPVPRIDISNLVLGSELGEP